VRLVSYAAKRGRRPCAGVLRDDQVIDAAAALGLERASLRELLGSGRAGELVDADGPAQPLAEVELLPPIPDP